MNEYERSLEGRGKMTRIENAWHDVGFFSVSYLAPLLMMDAKNRRWQMFSEPSADDPYGAYNKGYMQYVFSFYIQPCLLTLTNP